jgi:lipopolysaccharide/colanic/teichoic acid biosynthesis glycosyltransferase
MSVVAPMLVSTDELRAPGQLVVPGTAACDHEQTPRWPITRLASWSMTGLLALSLLAPVIGDGELWPLLAALALIGTATARAVFEALDGPKGAPLGRRVLAGLVAAGVGAVLVSGGSALLGSAWSLPGGAITFGLALGTLWLAGAVLDLEVRIRLNLRRLYFVGSEAAGRELERQLSDRGDARMVGAQCPTGSLDSRDLVEDVLASNPTAVVIDRFALHLPAVRQAALQLERAGVRVRDRVSFCESEFKKVPLDEISEPWLLFDAPGPGLVAGRRLRHAADAVAAVLLLVLFAPVLALAGVAIKLTSPGPVLYRQRRVGQGGVPFTLVKLRTMIAADQAGAAWAGSEQHRITGVGQFLRHFRIDELPQLWNVVRGDLAIIGPRPEQVPIVQELEQQIAHYGLRHWMRPGITGWAQVSLGYAGSLEGTAAKLQRDLYYARHRCLRLDALIVWLTFKTVIAGGG